MKLLEQPTEYLLVKANTTSVWDDCEFAIIHITEQWKEEQTKRLELLKPLKDNLRFLSMNYHDTAVDFYRVDENECPNIEEMLAGKTWSFAEFDEGERQKLTPPENALYCYQMRVYQRGTAIYSAYGKHTSEEFWTEEFPLTQIIEQL